MPLRLTSIHVRELNLREARFASQPKPVLLGSEQLLPLKLFPEQPPPGQRPASAPFGTKRHWLALRNATRLVRLETILLSSRFAPSRLREWWGNRRLKNRAYPRKDSLSLLKNCP